MPEEINIGVDCRKTSTTPRIKVRIEPKSKNITPGELVLLSAHNAPGDCDPGCYNWVLEGGGGTLSPLSGTSTNYRASEITKNPDCYWSATIHLFIGSYHLDTAIYTISFYRGTDIAYDKITLDQTWVELIAFPPWPVSGYDPPPYYPNTNHLRMYTWANQYTCKDKLTNKYAWERREFWWELHGLPKKWKLVYKPTGLQFWTHTAAGIYYADLNRDREGEIIDKRSAALKAGGCCPIKLLELGIDYPDESFPYY